MRVLLIEMGRAILVLWGKAWRRVIRSRTNFLVFLGLGVFAFIVWNFGSMIANPPAPAAQTAIESAEPTVEYVEVTALPLDAGEATPGSPRNDTQGSVEAAAPSSAAVVPQSSTGQTGPTVEAKNPESVAKGFVSSYLNRPARDWNEWQAWVAEYSTPELVVQISKANPLEDSGMEYPVSVKSVEIMPAKQDAAMDTPVRWSRNVAVTVEGANGETDSLGFAVMLFEGENGWVVTEVVRAEA